jgi:hypothetical protein
LTYGRGRDVTWTTISQCPGSAVRERGRVGGSLSLLSKSLACTVRSTLLQRCPHLSSKITPGYCTYAMAMQLVGPKREKLRQAEEQLAAANRKLSEKQASLKQVELLCRNA